MSIESQVINHSHAISSHFISIFLAALLGLSLIFMAGFAKTDILHNATHDARHSAGFPCH